jgi:hypothetical protein
MFIEDLINRLAGDGQYLFIAEAIPVFSMDDSIINSLSNQIVMGNGFTEKQSYLALKIVKKYSRVLSIALNKDITPFINSPQYKLPIRVISQAKSITIKKVNGSNKKIISINFPYNEGMIANIKGYKKLLSHKTHVGNSINWNLTDKSWDFDLREEHITWINSNVVDNSFVVDEMFEDLVKQIELVKSNIENYVPMVIFEENKFKFINVPSSVPQPISLDVVDVLVAARKYGITVWSETIDAVLGKIELNPFLLKFLTSPNLTSLPEDREKLTISDITSIVECSLPCLVVIPGGSELKHLELCYKLFQKYGILPKEMTVLFRLEGETGKNTNFFIKENKLNNPISEKIKIVFISGKVPKPLVESKTNFSTILNFGISGVHYTLTNYLKNHHFVINYTMKESDFANV